MARSDPHPVHRFESWQVWPGSFENPPVDGKFPAPESGRFAITPKTPIASLGSCFAREIKRRLIQRGYNYITEETAHPASIHASAAWERVYSTHCMRQIFEYTFGQWQPDVRWWLAPESKQVQDPYRRVILYEDLEKAEADFNRHRRHSRKALSSAAVLILTLGLTEIWQDSRDGSVICLPAGPYVKEGGDMSRYRFRVSRYSENLENLERIHDLMTVHNPNCKIIITVSPVNLWATFRQDADVISASCNSKATLRAAADEFTARHDNVYYFPAFEMATIYQPLSGQTYFSEGRENFHINKPTVKFIMQHFFRFFATGEYNAES
ncbi:MAG: GSCFA domain-containing protein [Deltaproteobacteria bacterium]|nr:GSCFA domain-containing protein [Deltaproteobacteria bacterium]